MTQKKLEKKFIKGQGKDLSLSYAHEILNGDLDLDVVIKACLNENVTVAMKSSWVLQIALSKDRNLLSGKTSEIIEILEESPVQGTRREAMKILILLYPWSEREERTIVELCLVIMEAEESAAAEKYFSMKIMNRIYENHPEDFKHFYALVCEQEHEVTDNFQRNARKFIEKHRVHI